MLYSVGKQVGLYVSREVGRWVGYASFTPGYYKAGWQLDMRWVGV